MMRPALAAFAIHPRKVLRNRYIASLLIIAAFLACTCLFGGELATYASFISGQRSSYLSLLPFAVGIGATADRVEDLEGGIGLRAAAYVRVSTRRQAPDGYSQDAQQGDLRKLAQTLGISKIFWYIDAKTGKDFDRKKLDCILDLAEAGEIQRLLIVHIDRVGRISRRLLSFFSELRDFGVVINTPDGEIDINRLEDMLITAIKAWAAQHDNERRAKAATAGKRESFRKKHWNKPVPPGYRFV
jgi:DNA invertase Pin-like site-specific DNA recombinase